MPSSTQELLSDERIELLLSWQNTGFSVHNTVTLESEDPAGAERIARYLLRPPLLEARYDLRCRKENPIPRSSG